MLSSHMQVSQKVLGTAAALGAAALLVNLVADWALPNSVLRPGNLLLFISAIATGLHGGLIAVATGVLPETLISGQHLDGVRMLIVCGVIGYASRRFPRVPAFVVCLTLWLAAFCFVWSASPLFLKSLGTALVTEALAEIFLAALAGTILLNPSVWGMLAERPKSFQTVEALTNGATVIGSGVALAALSVQILPSNFSNTGTPLVTNLEPLLLVSLAAMAVPALFAWWISELLEQMPNRGLLSQNNSQAILVSPDSGMYSSPKELNSSTEEEEGATPSPNDFLSPSPEDGVCALKPNGTILFVNDSFRNLLPFAPGEVAGKDFRQIGLPVEVLEHLAEILEDCLASDQQSIVTEFRLNRLPESLKFFHVSAEKFLSTPHRTEPIEDEANPKESDGVVITLRDITERRTVEAHLLEAQKMKSLGKVVGGIAHAFNNSLTNIIGQTGFALHAGERSAQEAALHQILEAANKAGKLVWTLLDFAEGRPSLQKQNDLGAVISGRLELLQKSAGESFEVKYEPPQENIGVSCDENLITQLLTDLVNNSRESYHSGSGEITISLDTEEMDSEVARFYPGAKEGLYARLRVSDHGIGMNREMVAKAFDPLFTTKEEHGQSGLGLSIVFAIVRAHDGFLSVESFPEKGTTISVYFPVIELSDPSTVDTAVSTQKPPKSAKKPDPKERILVVEDEPTVRQLVAKMLSSLGYKVKSCESGSQAIELCNESSFDLVVADMMMPRMGGLELIEELRKKKEDTKALVMTGFGTTPERESAEYVIPKPFDIETLAENVERALEGSE